MTEVVLALDVGGTKAHGALVDREYTLLAERVASTIGRDPGLVATAGVAAGLADLAERNGWRIGGFVAGFPEYVSREGVVAARDVLDWTAQPGEALGRAAGLPARIRSDVKCGARGELELGHGRSAGDFVYVSLGTGLSSSIVQEGRIREGVRGEAIGFGEWAVSGAVDPSWSGNLEGYASGTGIAARYAALTGSRPGAGGARAVLAAAAAGDRLAEAVAESAGRAIGRALGQLVSFVDPGLVVLAGGLGMADTLVSRALTSEYSAAVGSRPAAPALVTSAVTTNPGLLGAAAYAWHDDHSSREATA